MAAAGVILREPGGRVLFLLRGGDCDHPYTWAWPGGTIEPGETPEQAARRELKEETGYDHTGPLAPLDKRDGFVTFYGLVDDEFEPTLNDEHSDAHWTEPTDLRLIGGPEGRYMHPGVLATIEERIDGDWVSTGPAMDIACGSFVAKGKWLGAQDAGHWTESDHPRGQPGNAGQFGSGGGASGPSKTTKKNDAEGGETKSDAPASPEAAKGAEPAPTSPEGKAAQAEATAPATKKDRPPFSQEEIDSLPNKTQIRQPAKTWEELQTMGAVGREQFLEALGPVTKSLNLRTDVALPEHLTDADLEGGDNFLFVAPNKSEGRAKAKVDSDYDGDWSQLKDMIRGSITVSSMAELRTAVEAVEAAGLKLAAKPGDKFTTPTAEGYRDLNTLMQLPNGMYAELQFHLTPMIAAKNEGHDYYAIQQTLQRKNGNMEEPDDTWSERDTRKFNDMRARQRVIYGEAWEKATGGV